MGSLIRRLLVAAALGLAGAAHAVDVVDIPSADGKLRIPAHWFAAQAAGARPAVIALHGCNGLADDKGQLNPIWRRYAGYFNAEGMHFLVPDSFGPRGHRSICEIPNSQRSIDEEMRRDDVFAAMKWLAAQPGVDASRIVVAGWSHGAQTVLSVMDATDKTVQAQPVKPRAAVAFYPGCIKFERMFNYELSAPLLLMIGELDDWTPAAPCVALGRRLGKPGQPAFEMMVYPGSYHAFDGISPVTVRDNVGNTRTGKATVGGNQQAREQSHARMFDFLSARLEQPLVLPHQQRMHGHHFAVPVATGFADIQDAAAVPVKEAGKARYNHYLGLPPPKAFAVTDSGNWYFSQGDGRAMQLALEACKAQRCWLYAVDDRVVWNADPAVRTGLPALKR